MQKLKYKHIRRQTTHTNYLYCINLYKLIHNILDFLNSSFFLFCSITIRVNYSESLSIEKNENVDDDHHRDDDDNDNDGGVNIDWSTIIERISWNNILYIIPFAVFFSTYIVDIDLFRFWIYDK